MNNLTKNSEDSSSILIKNNTANTATHPIGLVGYIEFAIASVEQPRYRNIDLNTLIHTVIDIYYSDTTESNSVHYQDMKQTGEFLEVKWYKEPMINNTFRNVRPSQKLAARLFPPLPYWKEHSHFLL